MDSGWERVILSETENPKMAWHTDRSPGRILFMRSNFAVIVVSVAGVCMVGAEGMAAVSHKPELTADGLEFSVNRKSFKISQFELWGKIFDDNYGFTDSSFLPLDNRGYSEIQEKCDFEADSIPLHEYSNLGTVNYYPDTPSYDIWDGYDLIPENRHNYVKGSDFDVKLNFKDYKKYAKDPIMMQRCRIPQDDGGSWHVQRIGPFVSTGGYDWWQMAYPDAGMLSEALAKHPEGVDVIKKIIIPVLRNGTRLGYPPLHTHHIHMLTQMGVRPRCNMRPVCLGSSGTGISALDEMARETRCYNLSMFFEQHGDYICQPEDDGLDCLTEGDKNHRRLVQAIDLEGEMNDVRPFNSEPIEWFHMVAVRWRPIDPEEEVVNQAVFFGPGRIFIPSQLTMSLTSPAPTHVQTFMSYTTKMSIYGELVRMKPHAHAGILESMALLRGMPEDFGMGGNEFIPSTFAFAPIETRSMGFRDNEDLAQHILFHMEQSQARYDKECTGKSTQNLRNPTCLRPRPEMICAAKVDVETKSFLGKDFTFDRRPKTFCRPWNFALGEDITVVQFNQHVTAPPLAAYPDQIPPTMGQHLGLFISFKKADRGHSMFNVMLHAHNGEFTNFHEAHSPPQLLARMVSVILWSGPPVFSHTLRLLEWMFVGIFSTLALWVVHLILRGARKIPAVDLAVVDMQELLLMPFNTSPAQQAHAYEMVSLKENETEGDSEMAE